MTDLNKLIEILDNTGVVSDMSKYDPEKTFKENDVDSLDVMDILLAIEEKLKIKFSEDEATGINSLIDALNILKNRK